MKKHTSPFSSLSQVVYVVAVTFVVVFVLFRFRPIDTPALTLQESLHTAIAAVTPSVVMIVDSTGVVGTGIMINSNTILTSKHLLQEGKRYGVRFSDNDIEWASVRSLHPDLDLALLTLASPHGKSFPSLVRSQAGFQSGDFVIAFGTLSQGPSFIQHLGILSQMNQTLTINQQKFSGLLTTDIPFQAGYSGGPLVNLRGEIIGINTAFDSQGSAGWSTPVDENLIREWQKDIR